MSVIIVIVVDRPTAKQRLDKFIERLAANFKSPTRRPIRARNICDAYAQIGLAAIQEEDFKTASLACQLSERWYAASKVKERW